MGGGQKQSTFTQKTAAPKTDSNPATLLEKVMETKGVSFDMVKSRLIEEGFKKADTINSVKDIPKTKTFELIARLKKI